MKRFGAFRLVPTGLVFVAIGAGFMAIGLRVQAPSYLLVMGPVGFNTFGIAFVLPAMQTAALAPFPRIAGAAAAFFDDPVDALATIIPAMGLIAIMAWIGWRRLPEQEPPLRASLQASVDEEAAIEASVMPQ